MLAREFNPRAPLFLNESDIRYDGDPEGYKFRPSKLQDLYVELKAVLATVNRRFDRMVVDVSADRIVSFIGPGVPFIVARMTMTGYGNSSNIYIDGLKISTNKFSDLSLAQQQELLTSRQDLLKAFKSNKNIPWLTKKLSKLDHDQCSVELDRCWPIITKMIAKTRWYEFEPLVKLSKLLAEKNVGNKASQIKQAVLPAFTKAIIPEWWRQTDFRYIDKLIAISNWPELNIIKQRIQRLQLQVTESDGNEPDWDKMLNPTAEDELESVRNNPYSIQWFPAPRPETVSLALRLDGTAIKFIQNPTEDMKLVAVKTTPSVIAYIHRPSEEVQLLAVQAKPNLIRFIKNPCENAQLLALEKDVSTVTYFLDSMTSAAQDLAISKGIPFYALGEKLYPDVMNKHKSKVVSSLLTIVKQFIKDNVDTSMGLSRVNTLVARLRNIGIDWPELTLISNRIKSIVDEGEGEEVMGIFGHVSDIDGGREMLMDILRKDMDKSNGIFYVLYHMNEWGLTIKKLPDAKQLFDDEKSTIMKRLDDAPDEQSIDWQTAERLIKIGLDWPELDKWKIRVTDRIRDTVINGLKDEDDILPTIAWMVDQGFNIQDNSDFEKIVNAAKPKLLNLLTAMIKTYRNPIHTPYPGMSEIKNYYNLLKKLGVRWPELALIARSIKDDVHGLIAESGLQNSPLFYLDPDRFKSPMTDIMLSWTKRVIPTGNWTKLASVVMNYEHDPAMIQLFTEEKPVLIRTMQDYYKKDKENNRETIINMIRIFKRAGIDFPEFALILRGMNFNEYRA